ncbi:MAG: glutaminyl-peptide cyclotransferase [Polaribacter sp.]|jgi:glutaminyl-peptide cyclotransferase
MFLRKNNFLLSALLITLFSLAACKTDPKPPTKKDNKPTVQKKRVKVPAFNKDSAYAYIAKQVSFGPRVPNMKSHTQCKEWLAAKLESFGAEVILQDFEATAYTGTVLKATNIIGRINPENPKRIVLAGHWDTRHIADEDEDPNNHDKPILGADDAGSGVGVLLELARLIQENPIDLGIDIVFFDAEDHGDSREGVNDPMSWCKGAQYWAKNHHVPNYTAQFGILLDMVGGKDARFRKEGVSMHFAPTIMDKVWKLGQNMGYGDFFLNDLTYPITDDHRFVNELSDVRMIDIINKPTDTTFVAHWHTQQDDMSGIDKETLHAVGQTVLAVCYRFSDGSF